METGVEEGVLRPCCDTGRDGGAAGVQLGGGWADCEDPALLRACGSVSSGMTYSLVGAAWRCGGSW